MLSESAEIRLRYLALFVLFTALGCTKPARDITTTVDESAQTTIQTGADKPWGGLEIQSAGAALKDADQIIVLLHGYGADESNLLPLAEYIGGESRAYVFPAAPVALNSGGFAWATTEDEIATTIQMLVSLVRFASRTYPNAELSIGGFSQGATVSSMLLTDATLKIRHLFL